MTDFAMTFMVASAVLGCAVMFFAGYTLGRMAGVTKLRMYLLKSIEDELEGIDS